MTPRSTDGFTLTELLVALAVSLVVLIAAWGFYLTQLRSLGDQSAVLDATDRLRGAMAFVAREIRFAGFDPKKTALTASGNKGVTEARADRLVLAFDANSSGAIDGGATDPTPETVLYTYDAGGGRLLRTVAGHAEPLVSNVAPGGVVLEYLDADGNSLTPGGTPAELSAADRDRVAFVRMTLSVTAMDTQRPVVLTQTFDVALRNRILDRL